MRLYRKHGLFATVHILHRMCKLVKLSPKPAHKRAFLLIDQPNCGGNPAKRARGKPLLEQSEVGLFSDAPRAVVKVFYKGRLLSIKRRRTSPAQRYYITPEGESPQPACKAKPITGRTLAAQGRKARRLAQPSRP